MGSLEWTNHSGKEKEMLQHAVFMTALLSIGIAVLGLSLAIVWDVIQEMRKEE